MIRKIGQKTKTIAMNSTITRLLIFLIAASIISYIYFANTAVRKLTVLEKTRDKIQILSVKISDMESKRLITLNSINTEKALDMGFVETNDRIFIVRDSIKNTLSLNR
jgi:hypothetical protein